MFPEFGAQEPRAGALGLGRDGAACCEPEGGNGLGMGGFPFAGGGGAFAFSRKVGGSGVWGKEGWEGGREGTDPTREGGGQAGHSRESESGTGQQGDAEEPLEVAGECKGRPFPDSDLPAGSAGPRIAVARTPRIPLEEEEGAREGLGGGSPTPRGVRDWACPRVPAPSQDLLIC